MTDQEKIKTAWNMQWTWLRDDYGHIIPLYRVAIHEPISVYDYEELPCELTFDIVEFSVQIGQVCHRPWYRIYGKYKDTKILIEEGLRHG